MKGERCSCASVRFTPRKNFNQVLHMNPIPESAHAASLAEQQLGPTVVGTRGSTYNPVRAPRGAFIPVGTRCCAAWLLGAVALLALAGCSRSPAPDPTVLARVGDRVIRVEDVQREIA